MEALPCRFQTSGSDIRPEMQTSLEFRHAVASSSSPRLRSAVLAEACKSHSAKYCSRITIYECLLICYFFLSQLGFFFLGLEGVLLLPGGAAWNLSFFLSFRLWRKELLPSSGLRRPARVGHTRSYSTPRFQGTVGKAVH